MDLFLVLADWLDLGVEGLLLVLGIEVFRHRGAMGEALFWMKERHRQRWIMEVVKAAALSGHQDPVSATEQLAALSGKPLNEAEQLFARYYYVSRQHRLP
ncbi:MAG: hypothetical protein OWS74_05910 [Firmicutes bacterium]|nr:hypothetical protein [Bacillota bacterium]